MSSTSRGRRVLSIIVVMLHAGMILKLVLWSGSMCAKDRLALQKALTDNEALAAKCEELEPHRALYGCLQEVVIRTPPNYGQT